MNLLYILIKYESIIHMVFPYIYFIFIFVLVSLTETVLYVDLFCIIKNIALIQYYECFHHKLFKRSQDEVDLIL
jgi:hypothetical protein